MWRSGGGTNLRHNPTFREQRSFRGANTAWPQRSGAPSRRGPRYASLREDHAYRIPINGLKARRLP
jgi:hypothetical protein